MSRTWPEPKPVRRVFDERSRAHPTWVSEVDPEYWENEVTLDRRLEAGEISAAQRDETPPQGVIGELLRAMQGLTQGLAADEAMGSDGSLEQCMECEQQKEQQKELEQQTECG